MHCPSIGISCRMDTFSCTHCSRFIQMWTLKTHTPRVCACVCWCVDAKLEYSLSWTTRHFDEAHNFYLQKMLQSTVTVCRRRISVDVRARFRCRSDDRCRTQLCQIDTNETWTHTHTDWIAFICCHTTSKVVSDREAISICFCSSINYYCCSGFVSSCQNKTKRNQFEANRGIKFCEIRKRKPIKL